MQRGREASTGTSKPSVVTVDKFSTVRNCVEREDGVGGSRRVGQLCKLRVSRPQASLCAGACVCVCVRTTAAGLSCLHHAHPHLPGDPCAYWPGPQLILLTRIAVPVQWRCQQPKSRKTLHGRMSWTPRGCQLLHLSWRSMDFRARATCRSFRARATCRPSCDGQQDFWC